MLVRFPNLVASFGPLGTSDSDCILCILMETHRFLKGPKDSISPGEFRPGESLELDEGETSPRPVPGETLSPSGPGSSVGVEWVPNLGTDDQGSQGHGRAPPLLL